VSFSVFSFFLNSLSSTFSPPPLLFETTSTHLLGQDLDRVGAQRRDVVPDSSSGVRDDAPGGHRLTFPGQLRRLPGGELLGVDLGLDDRLLRVEKYKKNWKEREREREKGREEVVG